MPEKKLPHCKVLVFVCARGGVQKSASCEGAKIKHPIRQPGLLLRIRHLYILLFYRLLLTLQPSAKSTVIYFMPKKGCSFFFLPASRLIWVQTYRLFDPCVYIFTAGYLFWKQIQSDEKMYSLVWVQPNIRLFLFWAEQFYGQYFRKCWFIKLALFYWRKAMQDAPSA